jgi:hypothetical protein
MKSSKLKKATLNKVVSRMRKNSRVISSDKSEVSQELCLRYNTSVQQRDIFQRVCKVLLHKSKVLLSLIEDGDWVHVSIISEGNSEIKVYFNGMFDSTVLTKDEFMDNTDKFCSILSSIYIKGYVAIDASVDKID